MLRFHCIVPISLSSTKHDALLETGGCVSTKSASLAELFELWCDSHLLCIKSQMYWLSQWGDKLVIFDIWQTLEKLLDTVKAKYKKCNRNSDRLGKKKYTQVHSCIDTQSFMWNNIIVFSKYIAIRPLLPPWDNVKLKSCVCKWIHHHLAERQQANFIVNIVSQAKASVLQLKTQKIRSVCVMLWIRLPFSETIA